MRDGTWLMLRVMRRVLQEIGDRVLTDEDREILTELVELAVAPRTSLPLPLTLTEARSILVAEEALYLSHDARRASGKLLDRDEHAAWTRLAHLARLLVGEASA